MRLIDPTTPRMDPPPGDISFVESISVLDCEPAQLGHHDTIVFYCDSDEFHYERPQEPEAGACVLQAISLRELKVPRRSSPDQ